MIEDLLRMLYDRSFMYSEKAEYILASGRRSQYYVNCKPTALDPKGMFLIGHLVFEKLRGHNIRGVGGLTFGADPVAMATAFASHLNSEPIKAFSIRKTQKDHGIVKWIEGDLQKGDKVAIVEDVITTGASTITAVNRARLEGLDIVKVVSIVDRQEGGVEAIKTMVPVVESLVTINDLMDLRRKVS